MSKLRHYPKSVKTRAQKQRYTKALNAELKKGRKKSYAERVARGVASGKTKQQARGHHEKEHIERKQKEIEKLGIPSAQLKSIRAFLERFNPHSYKDVPTEAQLVEFVQEREYTAFQTYRKTWDAYRVKYVRALKDGELLPGGVLGYDLNVITAEAGVRPQGTEPWLYYH